jgi:hypothetical protein
MKHLPLTIIAAVLLVVCEVAVNRKIDLGGS